MELIGFCCEGSSDDPDDEAIDVEELGQFVVVILVVGAVQETKMGYYIIQTNRVGILFETD